MNATQSNNDDPSSMTIKEIRHELESLGINMVGLFEKSELIDALVKARNERKAPAVSSVRGNVSATSSSSDPSLMGTKELRNELESLGVSMVGIVEKSELIDALANARKDGKKKAPVYGGSHAAASSSQSTVSQGRLSRSVPIVIDAVPGLSVQTEFFSHDIEHSLYNDPYLFANTPEQISGPIALQFKSNNPGKRFNRHGTPKPGFQQGISMPEALVKTCNGIVESSLYSEFIACDYCLPWSYPENGSFSYHFDSRYRWGETVVGITLGCAGIMSFQPQKSAKGNGPPLPLGTRQSLNSDGLVVSVRGTGNNWVVDVHLPPRSVYVMCGPCRIDWKHMVLTNNAANRKYFGSNPNPSFANCIVRRTITLRCTKVFSDEVLRRASLQSPNATRLQTRIKAQNKFRPQGEYGEGRVSNEELQEMRQRAEREVLAVHSSFRNIFFNDRECGYVRRNRGRSYWPLEGAGGGGHSAVAYGGDVDAPSTMSKHGATAWSLPSHLPTGNTTMSMSNSSTLSKEELRQKRLDKVEILNCSSGTKRKEPLGESKSVFSGNNLVNLLDVDSEDEGHGSGSNELHKKPEPKKGKRSDIIHLDD